MTQAQTPTVVEATTALPSVSIKDTVLAQFKEAETTITTLAAKYRDVAYAVTTPKGMKEAVAARADLRDNGRLFVTKAETRVKGEVNELKRIMADEVTRLVAIVKPVEDSIDAQIKAEETRKAEEKAKRDREEANRVAAHRANIETIKSYVALAQGHTIDVIDHAAETLFDMSFGPEWEEFAAEAAAARDAAVESLNKMIASERQRLENERLQKELADAREALAAIAAAKEKAESEAKAKLEAEQEAQKATADKIAAEQDAAAKLDSDQAVEAARSSVVLSDKAEADQNANAFVDRIEQQVTSATEPVTRHGKGYIPHDAVVSVMPATVRAAMAPKTTTAPTIALEDINLRLAPLSVTAEGLTALGFETVNGCEYAEVEFPQICSALIDHIESVCEQAFA